MTRIPGLPSAWKTLDQGTLDLSQIPPGPSGPFDPQWSQKRAAWETWRAEVVRYRDQVARLCADSGVARERELALCRHSTKYFINVWCQVYEERRNQTPFAPNGGWLPAIQQAYMADLVDWMDARFAAQGGVASVGAVSKPRDIAATTTVCQWLLGRFLFDPVFSGKVISRKEELVDTAGDMDSLIERIASHLFADEDGWCPLPEWMRPRGIDAGYKIYRQHLKLSRPASRNRIRGESTSKRSARGGRSTAAVIDEASYIDNLELLLGAIMDSTQCLFLVSSESVETTEAFQLYCQKLKKADPTAVVELEYWMNLYHDAEWLALKKAQAVSEAAFRREQLRDAYAGFSTWIYNDFRDRHVACGNFPYEPRMPLTVGIDPGFNDETAIGWLAQDLLTGRARLVEAGVWRLQEPEFYAHILAGTWLMPDGSHCGFAFEPSDYRLMEWTFGLPRPTIAGDPSGWARKSAHNDSVYDRIRTRYKLLTGLSLDIRKQYGPNELRTYQTRWNALRGLLKTLDFHATPGVEYVKAAIEHSRLEEDRTKNLSSEQHAPRHNWASHPTSMMEFLAQHLELLSLLGHTTTVNAHGERLPGKVRQQAVLERITPLSRTAVMERTR